MRKLLVTMLVLGLLVLPALADKGPSAYDGPSIKGPSAYKPGPSAFKKGPTAYRKPGPATKQVIETQEQDNAAGAGVDIVLYQDTNPDAKLEEVVIEEKYDFANESNAVYAVVKWNVFKFFNKEVKDE